MLIELFISTGLEIIVDFQKPVAKEQYRWVNTVLKDPHPIPNQQGVLSIAPYFDPPFGGHSYKKADTSIYYWNNNDCKECEEGYKVNYHWKGNKFRFQDYPNEPRLTGLETIQFHTCLVDTIKNDEELFCVNWSLTSINTIIVNYTTGNIKHGL